MGRSGGSTMPENSLLTRRVAVSRSVSRRANCLPINVLRSRCDSATQVSLPSRMETKNYVCARTCVRVCVRARVCVRGWKQSRKLAESQNGHPRPRRWLRVATQASPRRHPVGPRRVLRHDLVNHRHRYASRPCGQRGANVEFPTTTRVAVDKSFIDRWFPPGQSGRRWPWERQQSSTVFIDCEKKKRLQACARSHMALPSRVVPCLARPSHA
jgi:hypothetical protein